MAQEYGWFKFNISAWMMGKIQKEKDKTIVSFLRLCCKYWKDECVMTAEDCKIECGEAVFEILQSKKIIKNSGEKNISIKFLDEQWEGVLETKNFASKAGKKSAEVRKLKKENLTGVEQPLKSVQRISTDKNRIEENREEQKENRKENKVEDVAVRKLKFSETLKPFLNEYGKDMLNEFYSHWTQFSGKSKTKMLFEKREAWTLSLRLKNWKRNDFGKNKKTAGAPPTTVAENFQTTNKKEIPE